MRCDGSMRLFKAGCGALAALMMATACVSAPDPIATDLPSGNVARASTSVTDALSCMDDLLLAKGVKDIPITIKGVPDATGNARVGAREMLISALMKMSARSSAFHYTDFQSIGDPYSSNDFDFTSAARGGAATPKFFIRGAISQLDEGVASVTQGGGVKIGKLQLGSNKDSTASVITVDMNLGVVATGQILPITASNSISFRRSGSGSDGSAEIAKNGVFFQYSLSRSEGMSQAARTLIEFNAIELAGEMTQTPYWRCLGLTSTNKDIQTSLRRRYDKMSVDSRTAFARDALTGLGRLDAAKAPRQDIALADALGKYQAERRLSPTGQVDFPTYAALTDQAASIDVSQAIIADVKPPFVPIKVAIKRTEPTGAPKLGDAVQVAATVNKDGYLYCYLNDADGNFARIFPNRWQPNALVKAETPLQIPGPEAGFDLVVDHTDKVESIVCFASSIEFGPNLPATLRKADLETISGLDLSAFINAVKTVAGDDLAAQQVKYIGTAASVAAQ